MLSKFYFWVLLPNTYFFCAKKVKPIDETTPNAIPQNDDMRPNAITRPENKKLINAPAKPANKY